MTCDRCARTIDDAVVRIPGVVETATDHHAGQSRIVAEASVDALTLAGVIRGKGFRVVAQKDRLAPPKQGEELDLLILGAGSAGFAAAIKATELGAKVAIVERGALGGTCVNVGCVPSKTLIRAAEAHHQAGRSAFAGIHTKNERPDLRALVLQKAKLVAELRQAKYWDVLAAYPSILLMKGEARFRVDGTVLVDGQPVRARRVLLAMGASPWAPPIPGLSDTPFLTSTTLMELEELPRRLIVIGGGAVGLELAQTFARLGSRVTVLEALAGIVPAEDPELGGALAGYLREEGLEVRAGVRILEISGAPGGYRVVIEDADGRGVIEGDQLLVATGRRPNTRGMGLAEAGIALGERGEVLVDEHLQTRLAHVYAAGDVIGDPAFVYVAAYAGNLAAENALSGDARTYDLSVVPRVTFTSPAVASVGLTEVEARARGLAVAVSKLPMAHVPRALAARDTRGFIKLVADERTGLLIGAHILAPEAGEMIEQAVMAMRFGIRIDELASLMHPYLTNAEGLKLACQTFEKDVAKLSCCAA
ncbi:MAG: mercury(II) reductase [Deltaproteobacteria bacterium]|nr:mercury(II) reductase [Deltaproteobacteria bacterium]